MANVVECEVIGGPLDGAVAQVREFQCAACRESHLAYEFPGVIRDLSGLVWLARQRVGNYVADLQLKRLTWVEPEDATC